MEDTIAAVSTPPGSAGIGIIRMSGPESLTILDKVFRPKNPEKERKSHTIHYGHIVESSRIIDEVLVSVMKAPHTYTREDIAEINCHGGPVVLQKVMKLLLENGARLAAAGEFTKRAFLNGRLDLSQAEAVMDMISAKTERELAGFAAHLSGELKKRVTALREKMIQLLANIEVGIDYPEYEFETLEQPAMIAGIKDILEEVETLGATYENGRLIKDGIRTAIIGKPNVGKSSILNALLRANRAIVTDIAGTTRDTLEEYYYLNGLTLKLIDTAGIRESGDTVEKIGIERSLQSIHQADLILFVIDSSSDLAAEDHRILEEIRDKKCIFILNKVDLAGKIDRRYFAENYPAAVVIETSALTGYGIDHLEKIITDLFALGQLEQSDGLYITNLRQKEALVGAAAAMRQAIASVQAGLSEEFWALDLKAAYLELSKILGESVEDDVVTQIFARFCVGK
ncbi:tRNA uridine-5-carboxymethylaminomethyl(34) synthesis GTPase MnmE [Lachnospiraceae bacterium oral taxon 500]|nr:tRNA uridine-5-carboxymethylaminomethyl(34) synthesis GTPase MnmE [Lachnospiraceae bacterium oral taxon 500]